MKHIVFIIAVIISLLFSPAMAGESKVTVNVESTRGATISHTDFQSEASGADLGFITGGENYNSISSGSHVVTLGSSTYKDKTVADSRIKNTYTRKNELTFEDAAVGSTTYSMTDNKANIPDEECDAAGTYNGQNIGTNGTIIEGQYPSHQTATAMFDIAGSYGGEYSTSGTLNDVNLTASMRAQGNAGGATSYYGYHVEAGFNKDSPTMNFEKSGYGHYSTYDNNLSGYKQAFEYDYTSHDQPFETLDNVTRLSITPNSTPNMTVNLTVNQTANN